MRQLGHGQEVTLNRSKALNALNLNMVHLLKPHYTVRPETGGRACADESRLSSPLCRAPRSVGRRTRTSRSC